MPSERISLIHGDIAAVSADAIVNAANSALTPGGGVGLAIHRAAGPELEAACAKIPGCQPGDAVITAAYRLPAKFVIHAVGPSWHGGKRREETMLARTYQRCFALAAEHDVHTIAFPAISCGVYGFPAADAARIAVHETIKALRASPSLERVTFVLFNEDVYREFAAAVAAQVS